MRRATNTRAKVQERRLTVAELYSKGWRCADIATHCEVAINTISNDLVHIRKMWQEECVLDYKTALAAQLAKLDKTECEAWAAWQRSMNPIVTTKESPDGEIEVITKTSAGDPRFLSEVQGCIDKRAKLMGLYAPEKHDHQFGGERVTIVEVLVDNKEDARKALKFDEFAQRAIESKQQAEKN